MSRLISRAWVAVLLFLTAVLLLIAAAPLAGFRATVLTGGSMSPAYEAGGMVLVDKVDPASIRVDDVITYTNQSDGLTTHRVIGVESPEGELAFRTKGDANPTADVDLTPGPLVIGKVVADISWAAPLLTSVTGSKARVLVPGILAMWLAIAEIRDLRRWRRDAADMVDGEEAADAEPLEPPASIPSVAVAGQTSTHQILETAEPAGPPGMVRIATIAPPRSSPRVPPPGPPPLAAPATAPAAPGAASAPTTAAPAAVTDVSPQVTTAPAQPAAAPDAQQPAVPAGGEATPPGYVPVVVWMQWPPQLVWPEQQRGLAMHDTPGGTTSVPESVPSWLTEQVADDVAAESAQRDAASAVGRNEPAPVAGGDVAAAPSSDLAASPVMRATPHTSPTPADGATVPLATPSIELRGTPRSSPPSLTPPTAPARPGPPSTPPPLAQQPAGRPMPVAASASPPAPAPSRPVPSSAAVAPAVTTVPDADTGPAWLLVDGPPAVAPPRPAIDARDATSTSSPSWLDVPARRTPPSDPPPVAASTAVVSESGNATWHDGGIVGWLMRSLVVVALVIAGIGGGSTLISGAVLTQSVPVDVAAISTLTLTTPVSVAAVEGCSGVAHKITVSWADGASEDGYDILRRTGTDPYAVVAHVGADAVQYIDSGLLANTTYDYKVRATRASWVSAEGGPVSATTNVVCV